MCEPLEKLFAMVRINSVLCAYRLLQELDETLGNGAHVSNGVSAPPHAILSSAKQVMDEELKCRMIAETRRVLIKQLAEAELLEVTENNKVCIHTTCVSNMHCCISYCDSVLMHGWML